MKRFAKETWKPGGTEVEPPSVKREGEEAEEEEGKERGRALNPCHLGITAPLP